MGTTGVGAGAMGKGAWPSCVFSLSVTDNFATSGVSASEEPEDEVDLSLLIMPMMCGVGDYARQLGWNDYVFRWRGVMM